MEDVYKRQVLILLIFHDYLNRSQIRYGLTESNHAIVTGGAVEQVGGDVYKRQVGSRSDPDAEY